MQQGMHDNMLIGMIAVAIGLGLYVITRPGKDDAAQVSRYRGVSGRFRQLAVWAAAMADAWDEARRVYVERKQGYGDSINGC